jgi:hypothetical protein
MMKKRLLIGVVMMAAVLVGALPTSAQEDQCMQKGGTWDATQQKCTQFLSVELSIHYPLEFVPYDFAQQAIDQYLFEQRVAFAQAFTSPDFYYSPGPLALDIDYTTSQFNEDIVGIEFTVYSYTGGAHPSTVYQTFTFDLAQQRVLTLEDLFLPGTNPLDVIAPIAQQSITTQLGELAIAAWIAQGTAPDPVNYQTWMVTPDTLILVFQSYQVASGAEGPQTVVIPLSDLSAILAPPFNGTN